MKRKFISMICVLSMIFSAIGSLSVITAQADDVPTISSTVTNNNDGTATIVFNYSGMTAIDSWQFNASIDPNVFDTTNILAEDEDGALVNITKPARFSGTTLNYVDGVLKTVWYSSATVPGTAKMLTVTLPLKADATYPTTVDITGVLFQDNLADGTKVRYGTSDVQDTTAIVVSAGTLDGGSTVTATPTEAPATEVPVVTATPSADATTAPTATAAATDRPAIDVSARPTKVPTEAPATEAPVVTASPEASTYPQKLISEVTVADGKATITFSYEGMTGVDSWQFNAAIDPNVFDTTNILAEDEDGALVSITKPARFSGTTLNYVDGVLKTVWYSSAAAPGSAKMLTVTLPLKSDATYPTTIDITGVLFQDNLADGTKVRYGTSDIQDTNAMTVVSAVLTDPNVTPEPEVTEGPTETPTAAPTVQPSAPAVAVKTVVGSSNVSAIEAAKDDSIGLNVVFKDASGAVLTDVVYGTDYVVADKDGNILTEVEYTDMVNGYDTDKLIDLINNSGKFYIYNDKIETISADVVDWTTGDYIGDSTTDTTVNPKATATPTATTSTATDAPTPTATTSSRRNSGSSDSDSGKGGSIYTGTGTTGTTSSTGTTSTVDFTDLYNVESWAGDAIRGLAAKGVVNGRTSTLFDPEANVTRAEFTKMLVGALGVSTSGAPDPGFTDVASTDWSYGYIAAAKYLGLVTGRTDTIFDPYAQISRQEAAAMIYRASTTTNKTLTAVNAAVNFIDQADISEYAVTSVTTLQQAGIINGFEDSSFRPNDNATRAQAAVMLWKYMNL